MTLYYSGKLVGECKCRLRSATQCVRLWDNIPQKSLIVPCSQASIVATEQSCPANAIAGAGVCLCHTVPRQACLVEGPSQLQGGSETACRWGNERGGGGGLHSIPRPPQCTSVDTLAIIVFNPGSATPSQWEHCNAAAAQYTQLASSGVPPYRFDHHFPNGWEAAWPQFRHFP